MISMGVWRRALHSAGEVDYKAGKGQYFQKNVMLHMNNNLEITSKLKEVVVNAYVCNKNQFIGEYTHNLVFTGI